MGHPSLLRVLVVCTGNRARSQMTQGWLRFPGGSRVRVESVGTDPKGVHPLAVRVMAEVGVDLSGHTSDHVGRYAGDEFRRVLTVCDAAREACPVFPGAKRLLHRSFPDPNHPGTGEADLTGAFRRVRDEIGEYARRLLAAELPGAEEAGNGPC